ncbi:MAG: glutathione S-transferase [Thiomicrorhabdus sp.]|nr:MAG: glutathione S-transferase [Thiomicrorhabdus sp.]
MENDPVLYSYRRCPYAMRARMAIAAAGIKVEQREIVFWAKPEEMMLATPKGEVPVLILPDGQVMDECDDEFKSHLGHYKYTERFPEEETVVFRQRGEVFIAKLESLLKHSQESAFSLVLNGSSTSVLDIAIFLFVRQFAHVDKVCFEQGGVHL